MAGTRLGTTADRRERILGLVHQRGDLLVSELTELFGGNVSWHTPGRSPLAGDVVGREAVFARLGRFRLEAADTIDRLHVRIERQPGKRRCAPEGADDPIRSLPSGDPS